MIEIIFLIAIVVFLATNYFYSRSVSLVVFITSPWFIFSCFFYIIHVIMPFLQWQSHYFRYQDSYEVFNYTLSIIYALIAYLLVFIVMYASGYRKKIKQFSFAEKIDNIPHSLSLIKKMFLLGMGVYVIGAIFAIKNISLILSIGTDEYLIDRINFGKSRGLEILLSHWLYISCILFTFIWLIAKGIDKTLKRKIILMFFISFCSVIVYYGINSNRNSILILLLNIVFLFFSYRYTTLKSNSFFLGKIGIVLFVFTVLFYQLGKIRRQAMMKNDKAGYTLIEEFNNAFGNHENVVWLLENKNELHFGQTYIAGISNFIPRSIWGNKPLGAGPRLKNTIKPGAYVVGKPKNNSLTTGLLTELLMNFGIYGLFVGSLLFAVLLRGIGLLLINTSSLPNLLIIHFSLIVFSSVFIYSEFLGFLSRYVITILPLLIIKFILKK